MGGSIGVGVYLRLCLVHKTLDEQLANNFRIVYAAQTRPEKKEMLGILQFCTLSF